MSTHRQQRVEKELLKLVATFFEGASNKTSLITFIRVELTPDRRKAIFFVSVLPTDKETEAINFLDRQACNLKYYIRNNTGTRIYPSVEFAIDMGEKNRQRIQELSEEI